LYYRITASGGRVHDHQFLVDFLSVIAGCGAFGFARRTLGMNHFQRTYFPLFCYISSNFRITLCILIFESGLSCTISQLIQLYIAFMCFWKKELHPRLESGWTLFACSLCLPV